MRPTTDLEDLIRRLAGRNDPGDHRSAVPDHLTDLASEESRFLEAIRARTQVLFSDPGPATSPAGRPHFVPFGHLLGRPGLASRSGMIFLGWALATMSLALVGMGTGALVWWLNERSAQLRIPQQSAQILAELRAGLLANPPLNAANPANPEPVALAGDLAWQRVDTELSLILARLDALSRPNPAPVVKEAPSAGGGPVGKPAMLPMASNTPNLAALGADLTAIRHEVINSEAATTRQIQEMRTVLHELNAVVRRVLNRPQPSANNVALPLLAVAVQALINNLGHQTAQIRGEAVEQLMRLGPLARSALPALQQMLGRESDPNIRSAVETAVSVLSSN